MKWIDKIPWNMTIMLCLTLGLAPFAPPHIWEKILMLASGTLRRPIDIFDLLWHSSPWILLIAKSFSYFKNQQTSSKA